MMDFFSVSLDRAFLMSVTENSLVTEVTALNRFSQCSPFFSLNVLRVKTGHKN